MPVSSVRDTSILCLGIIGFICISSPIAMADDSTLLSRISPHISLNSTLPSKELKPFLLSQDHPGDSYLNHSGDYATSPPPKRMSAQDLLSLALGAQFQISDWLGIGAACTMPFTEEDTVGTEDLSIEAMVTMQF